VIEHPRCHRHEPHVHVGRSSAQALWATGPLPYLVNGSRVTRAGSWPWVATTRRPPRRRTTVRHGARRLVHTPRAPLRRFRPGSFSSYRPVTERDDSPF
jgi:hypothetical protein